MNWLNSNKVRLAVLGIIVAVVLGGVNAKADFTFGTPKNMNPSINSNRGEWGPCISADGLEFYVSSNRDGRIGGYDLWVCTRETMDEEWSEPVNLGELINSTEEDGNPTLSADGLELYFNSPRPGGLGGQDLYVTTRATRSDPWGPAVNLGSPLNSTKHDSAPSISADGLELYFSYSDPNLPDDDPIQGFCVARRQTKDAPWGEPVNLGPVINSGPCRWECEISGDGLLLMWNDYWDCDPRPGGYGETDIWFSRRATKESEWSEPVNLGPAVNTIADEGGPEISVDGSMLYFASNHCGGSGAYDFWQAPIVPIVDFNGDYVVDDQDLEILNSYWDTNETLCDIGPMPWGDGVVDDADLEVLMNHWGQDASISSEPIAHWAFDETEGIIAHDSAGTYDANLVGNPVWQPVGGMVGGALEFDGIGDYVSAPCKVSYLDQSTAGAFSIFAWVKGGAPGQVIISDSGSYGYFYLMADSGGNLMTTANWVTDGDYLYSQTPIADGQWHHVGFVWDGYPSNRILYIDGIEVAADITMGGCLKPFLNPPGINIGCGPNSKSGTFFSGLIDDVRIYRRALSAEQVAALIQ